MTSNSNAEIFEDKKVRTFWNAESKKWYISIVDVVDVLTNSPRPRKYWSDLKKRLELNRDELSEKIGQLKMRSSDGKYYKTDVINTEQLFRLISYIPSSKTESFKLWLEQIDKKVIVGNNDKNLLRKKSLILQEATLIFEKYGYESMKILDLAKNAGVSQTTIYSIFKNKEGLYVEYIKSQIKAFLVELEELSQKSTSYKKLYNFVALKFKYYIKKSKAIESNIENNPLFFNIFYSDKTNPFEDIYYFLAKTFIEINPNIDKKQSIKLAYIFNSFSDGYISLWNQKQDFELLDYVDEVCEKFILTI